MERIRNLISNIHSIKLVKRSFIIYILCEIVPLIILFTYLRIITRRILQADAQVANKIVQRQNAVWVILVIGSILASTLLSIIIFGYFMKRLKAYKDQLQKEELISRQKDVEFKMLASQINPHFLYNTLETIRMKARCSGDTEIEELVKMLAKTMRRNIQVGDKLVSLKSELEFVEYYLKIQQYRFADRIHYQMDYRCNIEHLKIMPLIIQPIVENTFIHGLETKEGKGQIRIIIDKKEKLEIQVIDDGIGIPEEKVYKIREQLKNFGKLNRNNTALMNVNQRIKLLYGDEYGISIVSEKGIGTKVTIMIPEDIG